MADNTQEQLKNYTDHIASHLETALQLAVQMQQLTMDSEGDSDLYRKLAFYLTPNLNHWVSGSQAGNIKDLRELFARRDATTGAVMQEQSHEGDGHNVLTKPAA
jgi:hypothetical protein